MCQELFQTLELQEGSRPEGDHVESLPSASGRLGRSYGLEAGGGPHCVRHRNGVPCGEPEDTSLSLFTVLADVLVERVAVTS